MDKVRYAIVGLGHGLSHVKTVQANPRAELVAVCDKTPDLIAKLCAQPGMEGVQAYDSYEKMLAEAECDAVVVAVPTVAHRELSCKALDAGKHVLQEKPLTLNLAEAEKIADAVRRSGRVFQVGYEVRSSALVRKIREIMDRGDLGQLVVVWWNMFTGIPSRDASHWQLSRAMGGGKLFDCSCHYLDLLMMWAGARFERVCAFGGPPGSTGPNADDMPTVANIIVEFANGVRGTYSLSSVSKSTNDSAFGLVGTAGRIEGDPWLPEGAGSLRLYTEKALYTTDIRINGQMASRGHLGFAEQHDVFIDAIQKGTAPACTVDEAAVGLRLMLAIDRSIATGRVVTYDEMDS